jgi:hypothetical protein
MRVILKPAGAMIVLGATAILAAVALTRPQKEQIKQNAELPASELFKSKKQAQGLFDSKEKMAPINLSEIGKTDWICWGTNENEKNVTRKAGSGPVISNYTLIMPNKKILGVGKRGPSRGLTWSNGTPTAAVPVAYGGVHVGEENGFKMTLRTRSRRFMSMSAAIKRAAISPRGFPMARKRPQLKKRSRSVKATTHESIKSSSNLPLRIRNSKLFGRWRVAAAMSRCWRRRWSSRDFTLPRLSAKYDGPSEEIRKAHRIFDFVFCLFIEPFRFPVVKTTPIRGRVYRSIE